MNLDLVGHQGLVRKLDRLLQQGGGEICHPDMLRSPVALGLAQDVEGFRQRHLRVRPMDEQQVDPGQSQLDETLIERALEVGGRELVEIDLGGDENVIAVEAGVPQTLVQTLAHSGFIVVALRGVDVAVAQPQRGLDRLDADRVLKRHGAKADGWDPGAVGFDDFHFVLLQYTHV